MEIPEKENLPTVIIFDRNLVSARYLPPYRSTLYSPFEAVNGITQFLNLFLVWIECMRCLCISVVGVYNCLCAL